MLAYSLAGWWQEWQMLTSESDERGRGAVALVVGDDLDAVISEDADTRVGRTQIDTDGGRHCDVR